MKRIATVAALLAATLSANAQMTEETARQAAQELRVLVTEGTGVIGDLQPAINGSKTTKEQVKAAYGSPISTHFTDSGNEVWTYTFTKQRQNGENFVPYLNMLESGSKGVHKELKVMFSDKGVVKNYSMNESKVETKSGLFK